MTATNAKRKAATNRLHAASSRSQDLSPQSWSQTQSKARVWAVSFAVRRHTLAGWTVTSHPCSLCGGDGHGE